MTKKVIVEWIKEVRKENRKRAYTIKSREELYNEACAFAINKFEYGDHPYGHGAHGECIAGERDYKFKELLKVEKRKARDFLALPESELEKLYQEHPNLKWQLERAKVDILQDDEPVFTDLSGVANELRGV